MQPNIFLSILLCCIPAFIAQTRKTTNRQAISIISAVIIFVDFFLIKTWDISLYELGTEGIIAVSIILALAWFGCLIAALVSGTEQTDKK